MYRAAPSRLSQAPSYFRHHIRLDTIRPLMDKLPNELVRSIVECLIPEPPDVGEPKPEEWTTLEVWDPWYEYSRCHRALRNLCLMDRRFRTIAQPLLYKSIAIPDEKSMMLLLRTFIEDPAFGANTGYLGCHITLTDPVVAHRAWNIYSDVCQDMDIYSLPPDLPGAFHGRNEAIDRIIFPQQALYAILCYATKLTILLLQLPVMADHEDYDILIHKVFHCREELERGNVRPYSMPSLDIHTILLQGDPEMMNRVENEKDRDIIDVEIDGARPTFYWPLFQLPKLTRLEVTNDEGIWSLSVEEGHGMQRPKKWLNRITHLSLHSSAASPADLYDLCKSAPCLESLYMTPKQVLHSLPFTRKCLDSGLAMRADTLRQLHLEFFDCRDDEHWIGEGNILHNLPKLRRLETLYVHLQPLFGKPENMWTIDLSKRLPTSLVELTLEDWWWGDADGDRDWMLFRTWRPERDEDGDYAEYKMYRSLVGHMLASFLQECGPYGSFTKLKKITFVTERFARWVGAPGGDGEVEAYFADVTNLFDVKGVRFVAQVLE